MKALKKIAQRATQSAKKKSEALKPASSGLVHGITPFTSTDYSDTSGGSLRAAMTVSV
jgi:hypothetical protein